MKTRIAARISVVFIAAGTLGCAALSGAPATSAPCADALRDPAKLQALSEAAATDQNWELAYRYLALIHILHPDSEENRELFPAAATLYRRSWAPHRTQLDSIWTTSEPLFLYAWLAGFFQDGRDFPQVQMDAAFVGTSYSLFRNFIRYAKDRPQLSRWSISAKDENGIVVSVTGSPGSLGSEADR
jgi:hypothetical protein